MVTPPPVIKGGIKNQVMSTTLKVLYFVYKAKTNSKGLAPLIFRLKYNKQVAQLSTGYFIKPKDWNQDKNQVKSSDLNHTVIPIHIIKFLNPEKSLRWFVPEAISSIAIDCFVPSDVIIKCEFYCAIWYYLYYHQGFLNTYIMF